MPSKKPSPSAPVQGPFMGLFLDHPTWLIPPSGFSACNNVRIWRNRVTSAFMGYTKVVGGLGGPVTGGGIFVQSNQAQSLIIGTSTDVFLVQNAGSFILGTVNPPASLLGGPDTLGYGSLTPVYITPVYAVGQASVSGTIVTGSGTAWNTPVGTGFRTNARAGDYIAFGAGNINSLTAAWFQIKSVNSDTSLTLVTPAGTVVNGPYTIRQCFNGSTSFRWSFEIFPNAGAPDNNDVVIMANGGGVGAQGVGSIDPIFKYVANTASGTLLSQFSFTCGYVRRFQNMLIYGNLFGVSGANLNLRLGTSISNSDNGLPFSLTTGVAGQYVVGDTPFPITYLGVLGSSLLIYMGDQQGGSVQSAQFVGAPTFFAFAPIIRGRGPLGTLVMEFPDRHEFVAADCQYRFNGLFLQALNDHIFRFLATQIDYTRIAQAFVVPAIAYGDIMWVMPLITDPPGNALTTAYVEHYLEQAQNYLFKPFTQRDAPSWTAWLGTPGPGVLGSIVYASLVGDAAGNVYQLYTADTQNGAGYTSSATFASRIIAGERSRGLIKRVYPFLEPVTSSYNLTVTLNLQDRINGPISVSDVQSFPLFNPTNRFTTHYRRGRLGSITFSTPGPAQPWTIDGYDWDLPKGSPGGQR